MSNQICANYASALFSLVGKEAKEYKNALKQLNDFFKTNSNCFKFLCAYGTDKEEVSKVIKTLTDPFDLSYLPNFISLLYKKHRIIKFNEITNEFSHLVNDANGIKEGYLYSSTKLDDESYDSIIKALSKKLKCEIELHNVIDSSLLGGIKVSIDGKVYDNTLKTSLENLTKSLLGGK